MYKRQGPGDRWKACAKDLDEGRQVRLGEERPTALAWSAAQKKHKEKVAAEDTRKARGRQTGKPADNTGNAGCAAWAQPDVSAHGGGNGTKSWAGEHRRRAEYTWARRRRPPQGGLYTREVARLVYGAHPSLAAKLSEWTWFLLLLKLKKIVHETTFNLPDGRGLLPRLGKEGCPPAGAGPARRGM